MKTNHDRVAMVAALMAALLAGYGISGAASSRGSSETTRLGSEVGRLKGAIRQGDADLTAARRRICELERVAQRYKEEMFYEDGIIESLRRRLGE